MAILSPKIRLNKVDFPTFGLPRMEMKPHLKGIMTNPTGPLVSVEKGQYHEIALCIVAGTDMGTSPLDAPGGVRIDVLEEARAASGRDAQGMPPRGNPGKGREGPCSCD